MDERLHIHNLHREGLDAFRAGDPHLRRLRRQPLVWEPPLLARLPFGEPGVYTLGGGRQVGKTTLLKQWMARLVEEDVPPTTITYLTAELADDVHGLLRWMTAALEEGGPHRRRYLVVDEVSYVERWDRAVKFLADAGGLEDTVLLLTGSDLALLADARRFLPGRRGRAQEVDFHLHPLTWLETATLKRELAPEEQEVLGAAEPFASDALPVDAWERCWASLDAYLVHGGFLTALNDWAAERTVRPATLATYSDWIRGDFLKRRKSEASLQEVLGALTRRLGTQLTWNALARDLSIVHPATVAEYVALLVRMDAFHVLPALRDRGLSAAPKKARKVLPCDPFILHAVRNWLEPSTDPLRERIRPFLADPERCAALVESTAVAHARRHHASFYLKRPTGEVDLAIVKERRVYPIEVKWRPTLRPADVRLVAAMRHAVVAARVEHLGTVGKATVVPLPRVLALLGRGQWPPAEATAAPSRP